MNRLTKQEQLVLCIVLGLLLSGWAVKAYRTSHPAAVATKQDQATPRAMNDNAAPSSEPNH